MVDETERIRRGKRAAARLEIHADLIAGRVGLPSLVVSYDTASNIIILRTSYGVSVRMSVEGIEKHGDELWSWVVQHVADALSHASIDLSRVAGNASRMLEETWTHSKLAPAPLSDRPSPPDNTPIAADKPLVGQAAGPAESPGESTMVEPGTIIDLDVMYRGHRLMLQITDSGSPAARNVKDARARFQKMMALLHDGPLATATEPEPEPPKKIELQVQDGNGTVHSVDVVDLTQRLNNAKTAEFFPPTPVEMRLVGRVPGVVQCLDGIWRVVVG